MPDKKTQEEIAIEVKDVSKSFTVYYDRANSFKERILFLGRNKKKNVKKATTKKVRERKTNKK